MAFKPPLLTGSPLSLKNVETSFDAKKYCVLQVNGFLCCLGPCNIHDCFCLVPIAVQCVSMAGFHAVQIIGTLIHACFLYNNNEFNSSLILLCFKL